MRTILAGLAVLIVAEFVFLVSAHWFTGWFSTID